MPEGTDEQRISVLNGGPLKVEGAVPVLDHEGTEIEASEPYFLCRCGASSNKPFCDGTHSRNNFNGQEFASYSLADSPEPEESSQEPHVTVSVDGPYSVCGVQVVAGDGESYEPRERQALCRCGGSRNKPFCDGSHLYMGFKHEMGEDNGGV